MRRYVVDANIIRVYMGGYRYYNGNFRRQVSLQMVQMIAVSCLFGGWSERNEC